MKQFQEYNSLSDFALPLDYCVFWRNHSEQPSTSSSDSRPSHAQPG